MKKVEIYKLNNDGTQTVIAVCRLDTDGIVKCEGDRDLIAHLEKAGIADYSANYPHTLYPKDGNAFLTNLKNHFSSGYLNASDIIPASD